ncbi:hypothetical protein HHK36_020321 [Tetracentron sinense]|uniref:Reverse transcriptase/retrotransposon-derived protein RNase H-like domain-containing protein n=1 Tax=Tetracentron sinense TaxID=13715 RepID=A0A834YYT3_TETSI|nr:hypothetical protein HHK36_020321 [Tetracentron sinense]
MLIWPIPLTIKSLRGFLVLTGYYRKFIKDYGKIVGPLTSLLKRNSFIWTATATEALNQLKVAMDEPPVLKLPYFSRPFTIECDAARNGIRAVLMQNGHPMSFLSQALKGKVSSNVNICGVIGLSYRYKKMVAIFIGAERWVSKLLGYSFVVEYKSEKENKVADALSRRGEDRTMMGVSRPVMSWLDDVQLANKDYPKIQLLMDRFEKGELGLRKSSIIYTKVQAMATLVTTRLYIEFELISFGEECDPTYVNTSRNARYVKEKLFLLDGVTSNEATKEEDEGEGVDNVLDIAEAADLTEISLHMIAGAPSPQTMRLKGTCRKYQ